MKKWIAREWNDAARLFITWPATKFLAIIIGLYGLCEFGCYVHGYEPPPGRVVKIPKRLRDVKSVFPEMEQPLIELDPKPKIVWVHTLVCNDVKIIEYTSPSASLIEKDDSKWNTHLLWKDSNGLEHKLWANESTTYYRRQVILPTEEKSND